MTAPKHREVRLTETLRLFVGTTSHDEIHQAFIKVHEATQAKTVGKWIQEPVQGDQGRSVNWSMWIGCMQPTPDWYIGKELKDTRHMFALVLECDEYVALASSLVGDIQKHFPSLDALSYQTMIGMRNMGAAEFRSVRAQRLSTAQTGVHSTTTVGRSLERTMARSLARRSVPASLRFFEAGAEWRISPTSGRLAKPGGRVGLPALCRFFSNVVQDLKHPPAQTASILDAYAQPTDFSQVGFALEPKTLRFDASIVAAHREGTKVVLTAGMPLSSEETMALEDELAATWDLTRIAEAKDPTWTIERGGAVIGKLVRLKERFRLNSSFLESFKVHDPVSQVNESLRALFVEGTLPYLVAFSDPTVLYLGKQLFADQRLLGETAALAAILNGILPKPKMKEKELNKSGTNFTRSGLFGFVEQQCRGMDYLEHGSG